MALDEKLQGYLWYKLAGAAIRMEDGQMTEAQRHSLADLVAGKSEGNAALRHAADKLREGDLRPEDTQKHLRQHVGDMEEILEVRRSLSPDASPVNPEGAPVHERMQELLGNAVGGFAGSG